ncbi:unknown [Firmicutes bacterium CAG:552]|nr:unknown [Firmicutes bacterium CAG:552]
MFLLWKPKVPPGPPEPPGPGDNDPPVVQLIELNAPTGLSLSGDVVSWGRVENASGYVVHIVGSHFDVTVSVTETSYSLLPKLNKDGAFDVTVRSVGDNVTYKDSHYSAEKIRGDG